MKTRNDNSVSSQTGSRRLFKLCAAALFLLQAGCGGGGGSSSPSVTAVVPAGQLQPSANAFKVVSDDYGVEQATYLSATRSGTSLVLRAAVANGMTDPDFRTVARIDVLDPQAVSASGVYSLGSATPGPAPFAGSLYIFNGHQSTLLRTIGGTISFTAFGADSGSKISGSYSAIVEDGNDNTLPKATYTIAGTFDFALDSVGPVLPAVAPVAPNAAIQYQANCASCHALGSLDPNGNGAPELALKGGEMNGRFSAELPGHQGITLSAADIGDLKVLLNVN